MLGADLNQADKLNELGWLSALGGILIRPDKRTAPEPLYERARVPEHRIETLCKALTAVC